MTTDDTAALTEQIADTLEALDGQDYDDIAAAVLPIIRKAQADAWDEGHTEGRADEMHGGFPNPYRADQIEEEDQ